MLRPIEFFVTATGNTRVRIGISSCLLGNPVRYDGGHKQQAHLGQLEQHCEFIFHCPEVAAGLGVPRPPIELIRQKGLIRAQSVELPRQDVTELLINGALSRCQDLREQNIQGYILKARSPSCGFGDAPLRTDEAQTPSTASGLFAETLERQLPAIAIATEAQLDTTARALFFVQICQLLAEFQQLADARIIRWHSHYCAQLNLEPAIKRQLEQLAGTANRERYWQLLKDYLLLELQ